MLLLFAAAIFKRGTQKKKHFRQFVPPHTKTKSRKSAQTDGTDGQTGEKFVRFCVLLPPLSSCRVSLMKNQPPAFDTGPPQTKQKSTETATAATVAAATATQRQLLRLRLLRLLLLLLLSLLHFSSNILCFSHFPIRVARAVKKKKEKLV